MAQLNLSLTEHASNTGSTLHIFHLHACKHVCTKIDDIKPIVQSSCVLTRYAHNSLQMHTYMSEMHKPNLDCMLFVMQANCKTRTAI